MVGIGHIVENPGSQKIMCGDFEEMGVLVSCWLLLSEIPDRYGLVCPVTSRKPPGHLRVPKGVGAYWEGKELKIEQQPCIASMLVHC